ncbi:MAG TPA: LacI family DNA-binding transcriptional regulator, partial [Spirochaetales bacterium]|nr:LacI family DNA-binding transcriptional regulator [Spirochaetales bacterium]
PLTLKDVADEVGVHETTVSRIANRKYVQTDFGLFELRYFFTNSISGAGSQGSSYSKEGVKQVIKEIIQSEEAVLSDRDIVEELARRGIKLARRTVAKYRGELDLDSSFGRKRV